MERARRLALAAALILFAAFVVGFGRTLVGSWHATGDHAIIQMRTLDVGGRHTPLVGPYSRYGWSHPGPALFYALTPMLRAFGGHDIGLLAGALVINALALLSLAAVTWRRHDVAAFVAVTLVAATLVRALGGSSLFDPWNPYIIVLPLLAAALCAWAAVDGNRWALAATIVLASFVAQTHIGAAPAAVALVGFALVWVAIDTWRADADGRRRGVRTIAIALSAGFVVWLPPVVQAATSSGGNLRAIWDFWAASHAVSGYAQGARLIAPQFAIPAPWMGAHEGIHLGGALAPSSNRFPVALFLLAALTFFAARRRDRSAVALCSLAWVLALATWFAASRIVGLQYPYLLRWAWVAGAVTWLAIVSTAWRLLPASRPRLHQGALLAGGVAAGVIALLVVVSVARAPYPVQLESRVLDHVRRPVLTLLADSPGPVMINNGPSLRSSVIATGLLLEATRAGFLARVPPSLAYRVDAFRTLHGHAATVLFVASDDEIARVTHDTSYRLIASYDSLNAADRRDLTNLIRGIDGKIERLVALERDHRADYDRLNALEERGAHVAVFVRTRP